MSEKIQKSRGDKNEVSHIKKRQMLEIGIIQDLKDRGIEIDKNLILKTLASVGFETSLRTLERDIASIAATDAGMLMGKRYSGLATSQGTRYIKMIRNENDKSHFMTKEWQILEKRIQKNILKKRKGVIKMGDEMGKFKKYLQRLEKKEKEFQSKYGHLMKYDNADDAKEKML